MPFLIFRELILVWFLLLHAGTVFTSAGFVLAANFSHATLGLGLCFFSMHSAAVAACMWAWRNSHIRHSEYVFLISPVVHRICFLVLTYIYLYNIPVIKQGPVIRVQLLLFGPYSFVGSDVSLPWQFGDRRIHPRKKNMLHNSKRYYFIFIDKGVVYLCFSIICVGVGQ